MRERVQQSVELHSARLLARPAERAGSELCRNRRIDESGSTPALGIHARTTALNAWVSASVNGAKFVAASTSPRLCESCEDKTGHHECDRHVVERDKQSGWYERP